jgi:hypothetical protein
MIHIYALRRVDAGPMGAEKTEPFEVASCFDDSLTFALRTLVEEGQLTADSRVGILDRPDSEARGVWLVNPWARLP